MVSLNEFGLMLKKRAHWTHRIIQRSTILRLGVMEETITDMHLFSIADEYNENVITRKFNRREEGAISGADWLWIIGEPGSWLPLLIQAKIINPQTGNCQYFDYKNGEQRRRLLQYARQHSFVPLYCIYSSIPSNLVLPNRLSGPEQEKEDWACAFLAPKAVRLLSKSGKKSQREILKYSIPWMDPFCLASNNGDFKGVSIANAIMEIRDNSESITKSSPIGKLQKAKTALQKRTNWENLDTIQSLRTEIPRTICNWFNNKQSDFMQVPLTGASIISAVPLRQIEELHKYGGR